MTSQINMVVWVYWYVGVLVYWYILSLGDLWELQIPRLHVANRGSAVRVLGWFGWVSEDGKMATPHGLVILAKVIDCTMVGEYLQHMGVLAHVQRSTGAPMVQVVPERAGFPNKNMQEIRPYLVRHLQEFHVSCGETNF